MKKHLNFPRLRSLRATARLACICLLISCRLLSWTQSTAGTKPGDVKGSQSTVLPLSLTYDQPKAYPIGNKQSAIVSDFKCGSDGTVFLMMINDTTAFDRAVQGGPHAGAMDQFLVTALTPSGSVVRFAPPDNIPGLRNFVPEIRYFVSSSQVYSLERAEAFDPADPGTTLGHSHLIAIYDYDGEYKGMIRLEPGLNPLTIAAFPSGDILVVSMEKLNQVTRLLVFDQTGRPVTELRLFDKDYTSKLQPDDKAGQSDSGPNSISNKLAIAHWARFGENLLMSPPIDSSLPLIEFNESGVARSINVTLPENVYPTSVLESSDKIYHVVASDRTTLELPASESARQKVFYSPAEIDDINPGDGSLMRRVKFAHGLSPVCAQDDTYTFLSPREEDGRLQVIRGTVIH